MNLFAEAAERSTVCGEDDACSSSYLCVSFLRPLPYISQPRSLCASAVYCVDSSMNIRVNRVLEGNIRKYPGGESATDGG